METEDPLFRLRMPADMKTDLTKIAKKNRRSLNAELLYRIGQTLPEEKVPTEAREEAGNYTTLLEVQLMESFKKLGKKQQQTLLAFIDTI